MKLLGSPGPVQSDHVAVVRPGRPSPRPILSTVDHHRSRPLTWGIHVDVRDLVFGGVGELESAPDLGEYGLFQDRIGSQEGAPSR